MPRGSEGVRLKFRERKDGRGSFWVIKDGDARISTGCSLGERAAAEVKLAAYIQSRHDPAPKKGQQREGILLADILSLYMTEVCPKAAKPKEAVSRVTRLLLFFGTRTLGDLTGRLCKEYAAQRGAQTSARRELEDFRAAIGHYFADDPIKMRFNIPMPDKSPSRERFLTYDEAALLLSTAWRKHQRVPTSSGKHYVSRHIARFILVGLYTGTRAARICGAALRPTPGRGYVDLDRGLYYRRPPGEAESNKRTPTIRLPKRLVAHIRRWERLGLCKHSIVEWHGRPVERVSKGFRALVDAIAKTRPEMADVTPHILRHTAITWAMWNGVPLYDASEFFGVSEKLIHDVYGHHHPDHNRAVGEALSRRARR